MEVANLGVPAHDADIHEAAGGDAVAKATHAGLGHDEIRREDSDGEKV